MAKDVLVVKIFNEEYKIKLGANDPEYIQKLAQYVDQRFQEYSKMFSGMDQQRLMMLVCLNLADEVMKFRTEDKAEEVKKMFSELLQIVSK